MLTLKRLFKDWKQANKEKEYKELAKINKELTEHYASITDLSEEEVLKLSERIFNNKKFREKIVDELKKEVDNGLARRALLASGLGAIGIGSILSLLGSKADALKVKFYQDKMSFDDEFYLPIVLPFSAMVYINGSKVEAVNWKGKLIDKGETGVDNSDVIQSAIYYVDTSGGGTIFIKKGIYKISEPIVLLNPESLKIVGDGAYIKDDLTELKGTVLKATSSIEAILKLSNYAKNICIAGIGLDGEGLADYGIYISDGGQYNVVKACEIHSFKQAGIFVDGGDNAHYEFQAYKNKISNGKYGILIGTSATDNFIANNIIRGCDTALYLKSGSNIIIQNHFYKYPGSISYGIYFEWAGRNIIVANQFDNPTVAAIAGWANRQIIGFNLIQAGSNDIHYGLYLDPPSSMTYDNILFIGNYLCGKGEYVVNTSVGLGANASIAKGFIIELNTYEGVTNITKLKNSDTATFSGNGSTKDFLIGDHGLAVTDPNRIVVKVTPISQDAINASPCVGYVDPSDNTKIRVKFASAPASGTNNVKIAWIAEIVG